MKRTIPVETAQADPTPVPVRRVGRLKARDRCDACGARAYAAAEIGGTDLLFCGHHFAKHEAAILAVAEEVLDERWQIEQEETLRRAYVPEPVYTPERRPRLGRRK